MRKISEKNKLIYFFIVLLAYLIFFLTISIKNQDYEYIYYNLLIFFGFLVLILFSKKIHLKTSSIIGLLILGFFHLAGGNFIIGGLRLYQTSKFFIPYDKLVHFIGSFILAIIAYNHLYPILKRKKTKQKTIIFFLVVLIATGLGAIIEIIEFLATLIFQNTIVGDYANNAVDLIANILGAIAATPFLLRDFKKGKNHK